MRLMLAMLLACLVPSARAQDDYLARSLALRPTALAQHDLILGVGSFYHLVTEDETEHGLLLHGVDVRVPVGPVLFETQLAAGLDFLQPSILHWLSNVRFGAGPHFAGQGWRAEVVASIVLPSLRLDAVEHPYLPLGGGPYAVPVVALADMLSWMLATALGQWDASLWLIDTTSLRTSVRLELDARDVAVFALQLDLPFSFGPDLRVDFRPQLALQGAARFADDLVWLGLLLETVAVVGHLPRDPTLIVEPFVRVRGDGASAGGYLEISAPIVAAGPHFEQLGRPQHVYVLRVSGALTY